MNKLVLVPAVTLTMLAACGTSGDLDSKGTAPRASCEATVGPVRDALQEVVSRFRVGMTQEQFTDRVGDLQVALDTVDQADVDDAGDTCNQALNALTGAPALADNLQAVWDSCKQSSAFLDETCDDSTNVLDVNRQELKALDDVLTKVSRLVN